jgi:hypothetical protein
MAGVRAHLRTVLLTTGVLVVVGGVAFAAIPDSNGLINACYDNTTGAVRLVDAQPGNCAKTGETGISWNQTGPAGPRGEAGSPGAPGAPGVSTAYVVRGSRTLDARPRHNPSNRTIAQFDLPPGSYVFNAKVGFAPSPARGIGLLWSVECFLFGTSSSTIDRSEFTLPFDDSRATIALQGSGRITSTTPVARQVRLECQGWGPSSTDLNGKVSAIAVQTLVTAPGS